MIMQPTAQLRMFKRMGESPVLQQGWFPIHGGHLVWKDIPLVYEQQANNPEVKND